MFIGFIGAPIKLCKSKGGLTRRLTGLTGVEPIDQYEPYGVSQLTAGSVQEKIVRRLKLSIVDGTMLPG